MSLLDNLPLAVFFFVTWIGIFSLALAFFRIKLYPYIKPMLLTVLVLTPLSWTLIQLMKINHYFHILNAPLEITAAALCMRYLFKLNGTDSFMMVTLSYGIAVFMENITSMIVNDYQMERAASTLASGIMHQEWIFAFLLFLFSYAFTFFRLGFTVVNKHRKTSISARYRLVIALTFCSVWFSNISVHFLEDLFLLSTYLIFFVFGYLCIRLYRLELEED
ncbi:MULTISPECIES: hypothetical protein [Paenibacillus]|uniref:hypothetical protein n=1 Tax=Paenibacillus TaxID=44249 RepID=UPI0022B8F2B3|nr:hypothetical protein [Paenibacillus caseinilyticus]MCZ8521199.1 hypothetical protein [Paenibacillus caseinilyticus]